MNLLLHNPHQSQYFSYELIENISICLTIAQKRVLECLDRWESYYDSIEVSQFRLAEQLGYTRETVNRAIKTLTDLGFIKKKRRYNTTCIYRIADFLRSNHNRARLAFIFNWFRPYIHKTIEMIAGITNRIESNVTPIVSKKVREVSKKESKEKIIKKERKGREESKTVGCKSHARAYTYVRENNLNQKSVGNEAMTSPEMTPAIRQAVQQLNLTPWGIIKLTPFPEEAIFDALERLKFGTKGKQPFAFVVDAADQYCKSRSIKADWNKYFFWKKEYKMPEDAKMTKASTSTDYSRDKAAPYPRNLYKPEEVDPDERTAFLQRQISSFQVIIDEKLGTEVDIAGIDAWTYAKKCQHNAQIELDSLSGLPKQQQISPVFLKIPKGDEYSFKDKLNALRSNLSKLRNN